MVADGRAADRRQTPGEVRGLDLYWDKLPREDSNSTNGKSLTRTVVDLRGTDHSARAAAGTTGRYSSWVRL